MKNFEADISERKEIAFDRILDRNLFLTFLDLEVKRARRYQNFLCLLFLKLIPASKNDHQDSFETSCQVLSDLLEVEMRESDILGSFGDRLVVLLPYADPRAGDHAKLRFEETLKYFDFKNRGFDVTIDQYCFPIHGTDTMEFVKKMVGFDPD